jgi:hypothetical protein
VGLRSFRHWPPNNASTDAAFHPRRGQGRPRPQPAVTDAGHLLGHLARGLRPAPPRPPHALAMAMHSRPASRQHRHRLSPAAATRLDPLATSPATRPTGQLTRTRPPPSSTGLSANAAATANSPHRAHSSAATVSRGTASNSYTERAASRTPIGRALWKSCRAAAAPPRSRAARRCRPGSRHAWGISKGGDPSTPVKCVTSKPVRRLLGSLRGQDRDQCPVCPGHPGPGSLAA